jgi:hypothetical protein
MPDRTGSRPGGRAAGQQVRSAAHAARTAPVEPGTIYRRTGERVDLLGKLSSLTVMLSDQLERAEQTHQLATDDGSPAAEHTDAARSLLLRQQVVGPRQDVGQCRPTVGPYASRLSVIVNLGGRTPHRDYVPPFAGLPKSVEEITASPHVPWSPKRSPGPEPCFLMSPIIAGCHSSSQDRTLPRLGAGPA